MDFPTRKRKLRLREFDAISQIQQLQATARTPIAVSQSPNGTFNPNVPLNGIPRVLKQVRASKVSNSGAWNVTVTFLQNSQDSNYHSAKIWLKGYKGNPNATHISTASVSPVIFKLDATGETVQVIVQACGNSGDALLATSPTTVIAL
jgi:hypothetical protein